MHMAMLIAIDQAYSGRVLCGTIKYAHREPIPGETRAKHNNSFLLHHPLKVNLTRSDCITFSKLFHQRRA